jgi:hypothetical protein
MRAVKKGRVRGTSLYACACVDLTSDCRLSLFAASAYDCLKELEIAGGQVLLMPLVGLAEWERKVWVSRFDIETRACAAQMHFRSGLFVREMKHYNSLPSTVRTSREGANVNSTCPLPLCIIPHL